MAFRVCAAWPRRGGPQQAGSSACRACLKMGQAKARPMPGVACEFDLYQTMVRKTERCAHAAQRRMNAKASIGREQVPQRARAAPHALAGDACRAHG
ncbi:hypothetical protein A8H35_12650 [Burkholderia thailandensis]|nr:hypothetical protein A8H31_29800 [Burkholderia thailandensis]AWY60395.1 hypothetical protein A8H35_12650 [Burkholderia thailandensis]AWY66695.1 hypothetical protein A8H36_15780 [Burkholderia thailandensis]KVG16057.1 hypothetical protein WJ25_24205 [Burkholderia thailandensis]NOK44653.1 hypothetical protein [Burkholderia thailandensis]